MNSFEKNRWMIVLFALIVMSSCRNTEKNLYHSFKPGNIWLDHNGIAINAHGGGIYYEKNTYFWFGEHKIAGEAGNRAQVGVHCYSSHDLNNWRDEGIVLSVVTDDSLHDIAKGCILERPKVIFNALTGRYVMWFHLEFKNAGYKSARSGVAVSARVTGPYRFVHSFRPNQRVWPRDFPQGLRSARTSIEENFTGGSVSQHPDSLRIVARDFATGQMARDQTLFVDDDGKAYHIYASEENSCLHISQLADDYLTPAGNFVRIFIGRFMEAPALFKHKGKYYFIGSGCTGWEPNAARSAVASSIWGPWQELGNPCRGADAELTFHAQSTYVLPVHGRPDAFIFMADRWDPQNAINGRYIWLPIQFREPGLEIHWMNEWDLSFFDQ